MENKLRNEVLKDQVTPTSAGLCIIRINMRYSGGKYYIFYQTRTPIVEEIYVEEEEFLHANQ